MQIAWKVLYQVLLAASEVTAQGRIGPKCGQKYTYSIKWVKIFSIKVYAYNKAFVSES